MLPPVGPEDVCSHCVRESGLCEKHYRGILPELARNLGWLKLMGEAVVEQTRLQANAEDAATKKAKRRNARKARRGYAGLLDAIKAA